MRAEALVARRLEYVEAAQVMGMGELRVMVRHILPNVVSAAIVFAMADMVLNIFGGLVAFLPGPRRAAA